MSGELAATALGLAIAAGVSPYATVAVIGLAHQAGWIAVLPAAVVPLASPWVIAIATLLTVIEFGATLVPGIASAWEAVHTAIRPPAATLLAVLTLWGAAPVWVLGVGLLAGGLATGTVLTKLGVRLAIDTSPEPVSNGIASVGELSFVALIAVFAWQYPLVALIAAIVLVVALALGVRAVWGMIWRNVTGNRRPGSRSIRS
jgi:hypothetical protein